jgi:SAM-dependent methyltransferase
MGDGMTVTLRLTDHAPAASPDRPAGSASGAVELNLGCGRKHLPGAVNLDVTAETGPDVVHDLNRIPWPFPDERFEVVHAYDVIEHLNDVIAAVGEIRRVLKPGGVAHITVPHFSCSNAFTDPTHRHYFGWFSFDYVTGEHEHSYYTATRFRMRSRRLVFYPSWVNKLVWRLANRWPGRYERRWAWVFPAWFLAFELEAVKPERADPGSGRVVGGAVVE